MLLSACGVESGDNAVTQDVIEEMVYTQESDTQETQTESVTAETTTEAMESQFVAIQMENPSWQYFYVGSEKESATKPFALTTIGKTANEITDREEWLAENGFEEPSEYGDWHYLCSIGGEGQWIDIMYDGEYIAQLDFVQMTYSDDYKIEDADFVRQEIHHVEVQDNVMYMSMFHYTYAESAPSNAYVMAVSLEDYSIIWKTQPLVCNSLNFQIVGDVIFCGYGFTAEPDYLYQLDKNTGAVLAQEPIKSMAEYIFYKEGKLYVRTYNTDYVFEVSGQ